MGVPKARMGRVGLEGGKGSSKCKFSVSCERLLVLEDGGGKWGFGMGGGGES